jgi:hypothetical protein
MYLRNVGLAPNYIPLQSRWPYSLLLILLLRAFFRDHANLFLRYFLSKVRHWNRNNNAIVGRIHVVSIKVLGAWAEFVITLFSAVKIPTIGKCLFFLHFYKGAKYMMTRTELTMNTVTECYTFLHVSATIYWDIGKESDHNPGEKRVFCLPVVLNYAPLHEDLWASPYQHYVCITCIPCQRYMCGP